MHRITGFFWNFLKCFHRLKFVMADNAKILLK